MRISRYPAVRAALVERYPRGSFCLASKLPTFAITEEAQVEAIFNDSLAKAGVDYFDYYLLLHQHKVRTVSSVPVIIEKPNHPTKLQTINIR